jgi:sugar phosphate isomerase/epimerase
VSKTEDAVTLTLGLFGCGVMGRRHILGLKKLRDAGRLRFDLAGVCDLIAGPGQQAADLAADLLGSRPQIFTSLDQMRRALGQLDAITITTAPDSHVALAAEALESGAHVLVEKPIALTVRQGFRLVQAAERVGRKLAVAIERENFGLTIDLSHLPLIRETPAEALRAAGPHLIHAHIGNCVIDYPQSSLYGDFHPRFGHPEGCNDVLQVVEFLHELHAVGYWGQARHRLNTIPILSIEVRPTDGNTSETILANGKRTFIRAWEIVASQQQAGSSRFSLPTDD